MQDIRTAVPFRCFLVVVMINICCFFSGCISMNVEETLLEVSTSPNGMYTLEIYRTEPDATVDFSIKAYLINGTSKKLIYNCYHESKAEIEWMNDDVVVINNKKLDLSKDEKYDWRK
ncbi:DUF5412 family protein [Yeguia hominis]|uniref:Uncharacterized protein n=1 Tax=Yeguia hominis TaxID=2763662 RepID=A0A926HSP4_9FIRM|nr:DUF5412 family protein [Yeguia hominis]MBC8533616.1 hypothetical protein [Yeguia hominis]